MSTNDSNLCAALERQQFIDFQQLDKEVKEWETSNRLVCKDLVAREALGLQKYGTFLYPTTNQDMLQHLYEELLDAAVYIKTLIEQRKTV